MIASRARASVQQPDVQDRLSETLRTVAEGTPPANTAAPPEDPDFSSVLRRIRRGTYDGSDIDWNAPLPPISGYPLAGISRCLSGAITLAEVLQADLATEDPDGTGAQFGPDLRLELHAGMLELIRQAAAGLDALGDRIDRHHRRAATQGGAA